MKLIFRGIPLLFLYSPGHSCSNLDYGIIDGYAFCITDTGTHPCAYIGLDYKHPLAKWGEEDLDAAIDVHGGITFTSIGATRFPYDRYWIGWDYAHFGDYSGYTEHNRFFNEAKRWLYEEVLKEVLSAIKQIKELTIKLEKSNGKN